MSSNIPDIPGAHELGSWFGSWPSFHDAEILELRLNRSTESIIRIHTWAMTDELDAKGFYVSDRHVVVTFILNGITSLSLTGFNNQNVIAGLDLYRQGAKYML